MNGSAMIWGLITISHISHLTHLALCSQSHLFVCWCVCLPACVRVQNVEIFSLFLGARVRDSISLSIIILSWARRLSPRVASMWCDVMYTRIDIMAYIALDYAYDTDIQTSVHTRYTYCFNLCTKRNKKSARIHHRYHAPVCLCVCLIKQFSTKQKLLH